MLNGPFKSIILIYTIHYIIVIINALTFKHFHCVASRGGAKFNFSLFHIDPSLKVVFGQSYTCKKPKETEIK